MIYSGSKHTNSQFYHQFTKEVCVAYGWSSSSHSGLAGQGVGVGMTEGTRQDLFLGAETHAGFSGSEYTQS